MRPCDHSYPKAPEAPLHRLRNALGVFVVTLLFALTFGLAYLLQKPEAWLSTYKKWCTYKKRKRAGWYE